MNQRIKLLFIKLKYNYYIHKNYFNKISLYEIFKIIFYKRKKKQESNSKMYRYILNLKYNYNKKKNNSFMKLDHY